MGTADRNSWADPTLADRIQDYARWPFVAALIVALIAWVFA